MLARQLRHAGPRRPRRQISCAAEGSSMIGEEFSKHHRTQAHCVEPCLLSPWPSLDIRPSVPASRPLPTPRPLTHCHARAGMRWHAASRTVTDIPLLREREIPVRMSIRAQRIASITFLAMPPLTPARALGGMRPAMIRPQRGTVVFGSSGLEAPFATRVVGYASSAAQHSLPVH